VISASIQPLRAKKRIANPKVDIYQGDLTRLCHQAIVREKILWYQLDRTNHSYFQELIGTLRWAIELRRIDIMVEVSILSTHLAIPRSGHLDQAIHIFAYLPVYNKNRFLLLSD
jgi:hypothetical protein